MSALSSAGGNMKLTGVTWSSLGGQPHSGSGPLQLGQVYRARVEQVETGGAVMLRLGSHTIHLVTEMGLVRGQELLLRMTSAGTEPGFSILRVMPMPEQTGKTQPNRGPDGADYLGSQIQSLVSKQQPLSALLQFLQSPADRVALAQLLALHWGMLRRQFARPQDLVDPQRLRQSMQDSGLLLEAKLAQFQRPGDSSAAAALFSAMPTSLSADLKMTLWHAFGVPLPGIPDVQEDTLRQSEQLWSLLEGVSAQISLRQIHAITQAELGHFHWTMEVPLLLGAQVIPIAVTISRENGLGDKEQAQESWRVELALDLEPLGPLKLSMFVGEQRVSVALEAARDNTVKLLAANLGQLEHALQEQGFTIDALLSRPMSDAPGSLELAEFKHVLAVTA